MASALSQRPVVLPLALTAFAVLAGTAAYVHPLAGVGLVFLGLSVGSALLYPDGLSRLFTSGVACILIGYAFLGRPFAYLGMPPVYIGEAVLAIAIVAVAIHRNRWIAFRSPVAWLLLAFVAWGALRTAPFVSAYGLMALRDAVIWGYAAFALLLVPALLRRRLIERVPTGFSRVVPFFLIWVPVGYAIRYVAGDALPTVPGSDVGLLSMKSGDVGTHLGGIAAFLLVGLAWMKSPAGTAQRAGYTRYRGPLWALWSIGFLAAASLNRGGMLAGMAAIGVVLLLQPVVSARRLLKIGAVVLTILITLVMFDVSYERGAGQRDISPRQLAVNLMSLAGEGPREEGIAPTAEWRLLWWDTIIDYTIYGPYFWTGKGFGINLAIADGISTTSLNRNPHNGHLTVLARSGVPGLLLWSLLQVGFAVAMLSSYLRARRRGDQWWAGFHVWILAYWTAFIVNISFDVFLEGPQGGIWFWSLMGTGIAVILAYRNASPGGASMDGAYRL